MKCTYIMDLINLSNLSSLILLAHPLNIGIIKLKKIFKFVLIII